MEQKRRHLHVADLTDQPLLEEIARKDEIIRTLQLELNRAMENERDALAAVKATGNALNAAKGQLTKEQKKSVKAEQVAAVVNHWRYHRPKTGPEFGKPGSKTFQLIEKALVLMEEDPKTSVVACCEAIDGLHLAPWQEYDQRFAKPGGPKRVLRNQIEHALGDEQRIARCREILRKARSDADRAWLIYQALSEAERAWADEVLDLLREKPAPREQYVMVDGIRTRVEER